MTPFSLNAKPFSIKIAIVFLAVFSLLLFFLKSPVFSQECSTCVAPAVRSATAAISGSLESGAAQIIANQTAGMAGLNAAIGENLAYLVTSVQEMNSNLSGLIYKLAQTEIALEINRVYGPESQDPAICGTAEIAAGIQTSGASTSKAVSAIVKAVNDRGDALKYSEVPIYTNTLEHLPEPHEAVDSLGVSASVLTIPAEDIGKTSVVIQTLTNLLPLPPVPDSAAATPSGKQLVVAREIYNTKMNLAANSFAHLASDKFPTVCGIQASLVAADIQMGGPGDPSLLGIDPEGCISRYALAEFFGTSGLKNANSMELISSASPELLQRMATIQSARILFMEKLVNDKLLRIEGQTNLIATSLLDKDSEKLHSNASTLLTGAGY